jgi:hypothetical protein
MGFLVDDRSTLVEGGDDLSILTDQHGETYTAVFDGSNVVLTTASGHDRIARWLPGSMKIADVPGGGALSPRFTFTFYDHGGGNQRLHATWTFAGTTEEAIAAFERAGYATSALDHKHNRKHSAAGRTLIHMRSRGSMLTGADSGHAILYLDLQGDPPRTCGEVHVGEHNPTTGLGLGFLLHRWEIR